MKYLEQKPGPFWWTSNIRYFIYFVREISGITLGAWAFILAVTIFATYTMGVLGIDPVFTSLETFFQYVSVIALAASVIHSVTWLYAMPKIMPFALSKTGHMAVYLILLAIWIGISWLIIITAFAPKSYV